MCLNSDYAAALFEGKVQLHMVSHLWVLLMFLLTSEQLLSELDLLLFFVRLCVCICLDRRQGPGGEEADEVVSRR